MYRELIEYMFDTIDRRQWDLLTDIFDAEICYERPGYDPLLGFDRVLHFYSNERVIVAGKHFLDRLVIDGSYAACWGHFEGTHKNGDRLDERFADTYVFREDKLLIRTTYFFRPAI